MQERQFMLTIVAYCLFSLCITHKGLFHGGVEHLLGAKAQGPSNGKASVAIEVY